MQYVVRLTLALLACVAGALAQAAEKHEEMSFPDIGQKDLMAAIQEKKVILLDCCGTESYKAGHLPGALDFAAVEKELAKKLPSDKGALIVSYCFNEHCPLYQKGAKAAKDLGYTNVKHFPAGIEGWKKAGERTETAG